MLVRKLLYNSGYLEISVEISTNHSSPCTSSHHVPENCFAFLINLDVWRSEFLHKQTSFVKRNCYLLQ